MSAGTGLLIGLALLAGNAFFVGAEFAIISARRSQIEPRAMAGKRAAVLTLRGMEQVSLMLAGSQLGITICSLGLGAVAEPALAHAIEPLFEALGMPEQLLHPVAFVIALAVVVYLHIVIGEMVPKNLALAAPERSALLLAPPLWGFVSLLRPVIKGLNGLANLGLRMLGVDPKDEVASAFTSEQVATLIEESAREGMLDPSETQLASGALGLTQRRAAELVIPAERLRSVRTTDPLRTLLDATRDTGFSRYPVLSPTGAPLGYLHVRDALDGDPEAPVASLPLRPLPAIAADASAASVAEILRNRGAHLAQVCGESGELVGIIALEDVLEELIGEVRDSAHRRRS